MGKAEVAWLAAGLPGKVGDALLEARYSIAISLADWLGLLLMIGRHAGRGFDIGWAVVLWLSVCFYALISPEGTGNRQIWDMMNTLPEGSDVWIPYASAAILPRRQHLTSWQCLQ
jgi:hypothetical protein